MYADGRQRRETGGGRLDQARSHRAGLRAPSHRSARQRLHTRMLPQSPHDDISEHDPQKIPPHRLQ